MIGSLYIISDSRCDGIGFVLLQEDPSDDESGGPAVTSQPASSSSVFAVPLPADSNATENTSLNPQDKVTYTPGN